MLRRIRDLPAARKLLDLRSHRHRRYRIDRPYGRGSKGLRTPCRQPLGDYAVGVFGWHHSLTIAGCRLFRLRVVGASRCRGSNRKPTDSAYACLESTGSRRTACNTRLRSATFRRSSAVLSRCLTITRSPGFRTDSKAQTLPGSRRGDFGAAIFDSPFCIAALTTKMMPASPTAKPCVLRADLRVRSACDSGRARARARAYSDITDRGQRRAGCLRGGLDRYPGNAARPLPTRAAIAGIRLHRRAHPCSPARRRRCLRPH